MIWWQVASGDGKWQRPLLVCVGRCVGGAGVFAVCGKELTQEGGSVESDWGWLLQQRRATACRSCCYIKSWILLLLLLVLVVVILLLRWTIYRDV